MKIRITFERREIRCPACAYAGSDLPFYMVCKMEIDRMSRMIRISMEYDRMPQSGCGRPRKAPKEIVDAIVNGN